MVFLYHYTDIKGLRGILQSNIIKRSTSSNIDATFGDGVYLTAIPPNAGKTRILKNNYDNVRSVALNPGLNQRVSYYLKFDSAQLQGVSKVSDKRDVWLFRGDIPLSHVTFEIGETEGGQEYQVQYDDYGNVTQLSLMR